MTSIDIQNSGYHWKDGGVVEREDGEEGGDTGGIHGRTHQKSGECG